MVRDSDGVQSEMTTMIVIVMMTIIPEHNAVWLVSSKCKVRISSIAIAGSPGLLLCMRTRQYWHGGNKMHPIILILL